MEEWKVEGREKRRKGKKDKRGKREKKGKERKKKRKKGSEESMLAYINNKRLRQIFEAGEILLSSSVNNQPSFFNISPFLGKVAINSYNIFSL